MHFLDCPLNADPKIFSFSPPCGTCPNASRRLLQLLWNNACEDSSSLRFEEKLLQKYVPLVGSASSIFLKSNDFSKNKRAKKRLYVHTAVCALCRQVSTWYPRAAVSISLLITAVLKVEAVLEFPGYCCGIFRTSSFALVSRASTSTPMVPDGAFGGIPGPASRLENVQLQLCQSVRGMDLQRSL